MHKTSHANLTRSNTAFVLAAMLCLGINLVAPASGASSTKPDFVLFDFEKSFDLSQVGVTDAAVSTIASPQGTSLRIATGHEHSWPGVTLKPPGGAGDLSAYDSLTVDIKNAGSSRLTVHCRIDNPGADGTRHCVTSSVTLDPGKSENLRVRLKRAADSKLDGKLFGMRGYPVAPGLPGTFNPAQVSQILVYVAKPAAEHVFEIDNLKASGVYVRPTAWVTDADPFLPFIDTFGQYKHKDWPGKVHSQAELVERRELEAKELAASPSPAGWNQYGGWSDGPQLEKTGFFRTQKFQGKWWLVDPDGRLFFSQGIDCVRMRELTPVQDRAEWFEEDPAEQDRLKGFLAPSAYTLKGHYAGRSPQSFSFNEANLWRKYGPGWREIYRETIHRRLRSWGLNTIGMWSDPATASLRRTPYVDALGSRGVRMIEGSEGYWGKFPDVWDQNFSARLQESMASKIGKSAGDPWCIGYFADNEMSWGNETSLGLAALRSPANQPAKQAFASDLRGKYQTIDALNRAWSASYASWDALLQTQQPPDAGKASADLTAFYTKTAEAYFRSVRDAIKQQAPNQLYLGCRFAWVNPLAAAAAAKFCDIVSYNLYRRSVGEFEFNGGADVPLIIGEFHFGALDRGMFHTGLVPVPDQNARATAYKEYVEGALRHPQFVGCHWFQYQDQPTTGRVLDEENYQIGFVDIVDTPYAETIQASRTVASQLYRTRLGKGMAQ